MLKSDKVILYTLSQKDRYHVRRLMQQHHLAYLPPYTSIYMGLRTQRTTMADVIHVLRKDAVKNLRSHYVLRNLLSKLVPTIPASIFPMLPAKYKPKLRAIFHDRLSDPSEIYQIGQTVADLVFIYGINLNQINQEIRKGGLVFTS